MVEVRARAPADRRSWTEKTLFSGMFRDIGEMLPEIEARLGELLPSREKTMAAGKFKKGVLHILRGTV